MEEMEEKIDGNKSSIMGKMALGATGLAVVSGMAVAGVVLARNKKARKAVIKGVDEAIKGARSMLMEGADKFQAFQHRISVGNRKRKSATV